MVAIIIPDFRLGNYVIEKIEQYAQCLLKKQSSVINPTYFPSNNCHCKPHNASGDLRSQKGGL